MTHRSAARNVTTRFDFPGRLLAPLLLSAASIATSSAAFAEEKPLIDQLCAPFLQKTSAGASAASQHPFVGTVWAPRVGEKLASGKVLVELLQATPVVLMGEIHDNPKHHQIQACLLNYASASRRLAVVLEQIPIDKRDALSAYVKRPDASAEGLGPALDWASSGWPAWSMYQPIAEVAMRRKLPILAGDPAAKAVRSVAEKGLRGLPERDRIRLGVEEPLSKPLETALREELVVSHCNLMPAGAFGSMALAQRYRDAHLADAVLEAKSLDDVDGVVLIAGNGHVRTDRGVPWHLNIRAPDAATLSIAIVEVQPGQTDASAYVPKSPDGEPAADLIVFTSAADRGDPCEELRERFRKQVTPKQ